MRTDPVPLIVLVTVCLLIPSTVAAQMGATTDTAVMLASPTLPSEGRKAIQDRIEAVHARFRERHGGLGPEQFGTRCCQITQIPSSAFNLTFGLATPWNIDGLGYASPSGSAASVAAPISLPSGVEIQYLDLYYYDANPNQDVTAQLFAFGGGTPGSGGPTATLIGEVSSQGSGYNYDASPLFSYTVNNNVAYDPAAAQLVVSITLEFANLRFKAVDLWWMRQVHPAPVVASFSDVPTSHPFFQYIEALYAAGITAGCGTNPRRFCPNAPVTRGQEAVFISRALGLYWPN